MTKQQFIKAIKGARNVYAYIKLTNTMLWHTVEIAKKELLQHAADSPEDTVFNARESCGDVYIDNLQGYMRRKGRAWEAHPDDTETLEERWNGYAREEQMERTGRL